MVSSPRNDKVSFKDDLQTKPVTRTIGGGMSIPGYGLKLSNVGPVRATNILKGYLNTSMNNSKESLGNGQITGSLSKYNGRDSSFIENKSMSLTKKFGILNSESKEPLLIVDQ